MESGFQIKAIFFIHYFFALVAMVTGVAAFFVGLKLVPGITHIAAAPDNEFRFFSVFWLAYGCFCVWVTRDFPSRKAFVPALALTMFMAGAARMMSTALVGFANNAYFYGALLELIVPVIWFALYKSYCRKVDTLVGVA